jgi:hypothetical protein
MMRTERLLSMAAILAEATFPCRGAVAQPAPSAPAPAVLATGSTAVEFVKALVWPLVTLVIAVLCHQPIALY